MVVGAGTGAEVVALTNRQAEVFGIEPNKRAFESLRLRVQLHDLHPQTFFTAVAEAIPHPANYFDFVYCYTVLEHVQNVEKTLDEMIRVCKPNGYVFIQTPNYHFPHEAHYKVPLIPFAPKWIQKIYLYLRGRPAQFLDTVNFVTRSQLDRLLWKRNVITLRVFEPHLRWWSEADNQTLGGKFYLWFCDTLAIYKTQYIFIKKQI